ncbi:uncharacterized protein LOC143248098 [Tachypleus tridentatus]|uniref:uncharacterized protein LOC143248098 n=1 Tax=Tachypleus tridentatus TaxID=6853 RepID=UPI003FCF9CF4
MGYLLFVYHRYQKPLAGIAMERRVTNQKYMSKNISIFQQMSPDGSESSLRTYNTQIRGSIPHRSPAVVHDVYKKQSTQGPSINVDDTYNKQSTLGPSTNVGDECKEQSTLGPSTNVVVDLAQLLRLQHITLLLSQINGSEVSYYDCITVRLQEAGITTTVIYLEEVIDLDEKTLQSKLLPFGEPTEYTLSTYVVFVFDKTSQKGSFVQHFLKEFCLQSIHWVLFLRNTSVSETILSSKLKSPCFCSMVIVQEDRKITKIKYNIYGVPKENYHCTEMQLVGKWTPRYGISPKLSPFLQNQDYLDFKEDVLVASVISYFPYFVLEDGPNGTFRPVLGVEFELLSTLARTLNFRYVIRTPEDAEWGKKLADNSWSGMIGMVHRKEADLSAEQITITEERKQAVDFTIPYSFDSVTFITRAPSGNHQPLAIVKPFTWQVICNSL